MYKDLSIDEMRTATGGNLMKVVKFVFDAILGDIICNPKQSIDDFNDGRSAANKQWGK